MNKKLNIEYNEPLLFPELEEFFRPDSKTTKKDESMSDENYKTISEVAKDFDIAASVIRYWETKFKPLSPIKRNGRRYFSLEQQKLIAKIKDLLYVQGYTIRAAQDIVLQGGSSVSNQENKQQSLDQNINSINKEFFNSMITKLETIKESLK